MGKIAFGILILVLVIAGVLSLNFLNKAPKTVENLTRPVIENVISSPTPIPFEDLTIPYLRNKEFESNLSQLQKVSENQSYSSFLTSYQSDGLKINGLLTQPKGEKPQGGYPAIIFIHGYIPPKQYQTLEKYVDHVDYLGRNGFVVFKIDLRGHGQSEGVATGAYYSSDYITDVLNAYSSLENSDFVNPKKIGLWGHSMAGNVVLRTLAANPKIPAVVIWAGAGFTYFDLNEYGIADASYQPPADDSQRTQRRLRLRQLYGDPKDGNDFWKLVAPTDYLKDVTGAIQLHHAQNDDVVSIEYSENLDNILDNTSITHEFNQYSSGGHNITGSSFTQAMQKTVEFFNNNFN